MKKRMNRRDRLALVLMAGAMTSAMMIVGCKTMEAVPGKNAETVPAPGWTGSMQSLRTTLTELEPYLYDSLRYELPANRELIGAKITKLAEISATVSHDPTVNHRDPTVKFVASQFSKHLRRAADQYNDGRRMYARYEVMNVTRFCVECHTRMPGGREQALGKQQASFPGRDADR